MLKMACIFPDTQQIYKGSNHMAMHCAAVSQDAGLERTPLGAKICAVYRRLAMNSGLQSVDFEDALKRWSDSKSWYARLKMGKFTLPKIDEDSWLQQLKEFNLASGFPDPSGEYFSLMAELDTVSQLPFKLETRCVILMYVQRFGAPKQKGIELDLWSILRSSGTSVLSALNRYRSHIEMTKTKSQKARAKGNVQGVQKQKKVKKGGGNVQTERAPAAIGNKVKSSRPRERVIKGGREFTFCEYVQDIAGSVAFAANSFAVQPGLAQLFAWLSIQAPSYQEYMFKKLAFRFDTEKSSATNGKVMLVFMPDASDAVPATKQELLENEEKAKCTVWEDCRLAAKLNEALGRRRYIRSGALAANLDIKTYDVGQLIVGTNGCADTSVIGELYVEYTIVLMTPVLNVAAIAKATSASISGVTPSSVSIFGTTPTITGGLDVTGTVNTLTFNRVGSYLLSVAVTGTGLFTVWTVVTSASTATVTNAFTGIGNAAANVGTAAQGRVFFNVTARGQTLVLDASTVSTTITASSTSIAAFSTA